MTHLDPIDRYLEQVQHHINTHGWSIQVTPHPDTEPDAGPMLAYTVGLCLQDLPELVMMCEADPDDIQRAGNTLNKTASLLISTPSTEFSPHVQVPLGLDPPTMLHLSLEPSTHTPHLNVAHLFARADPSQPVRALTLTVT